MPLVTALDATRSRYLAALVALHIAIIIASNYLVQIPLTLFGFNSTWGAFSFPLIFLATDLTARLIGKVAARRVITRAMLPALAASYVVGVLFHAGRFDGIAALGRFDSVVFRVAFASYAAYVFGQLLDVHVFDHIRRRSRHWWPAPTLSAVFGQALDTAAFFSIAFAGSSNAFMAAHWAEIALVDYVIKLLASAVFLVPAYGVLLASIMRVLGPRAAPLTHTVEPG
ncbi:MAG: 7-cyano-7-deazaguanine/7-aminomethyl-7-deazaguanine transporter [Rhodanobacteraceae bacterium]|nr:MAG: 7-cyano-7-deazaguanine/7-aminomethyl-7-deazaguanine transporter [Rhodanobacteraceae bacterium]